MQYYDLISHESATKLGFKLVPGISKITKKPKSFEDSQKISRKRGAVLLDPFDNSKLFVDVGVLQTCKDHDVSIAISFSEFLDTSSRSRAGLLVNCRKLVQLCKRKKNHLIIVSGATDEYGVRTPLQLEAFGRLLGLTTPQAKWSLTHAQKYIVEKVMK